MTSETGYWIGGGLIGCAVVGAILWAFLAVAGITRAIDDFQRVEVPGRALVQLDARKYVIYVEGPGADESVPDIEYVIASPRTRKRLPLAPYDLSMNYSFNTSGSALRTVTPARAGEYEVSTDDGGLSSGAYAIAIGDPIAGKLVFAIVGALAFGAVLGIAGLALLIVTYVRRSRRRA